MPVLSSLGMTEIFFLFVLGLLMFGPRGFLVISRAADRALSRLRDASSGLRRTFLDEVSREEARLREDERRREHAGQ